MWTDSVGADGSVQITGHSKEIINRGSKKFFPPEVEGILYTHRSVMHVAMIRLSDGRLAMEGAAADLLGDRRVIDSYIGLGGKALGWKTTDNKMIRKTD